MEANSTCTSDTYFEWLFIFSEVLSYILLFGEPGMAGVSEPFASEETEVQRLGDLHNAT